MSNSNLIPKKKKAKAEEEESEQSKQTNRPKKKTRKKKKQSKREKNKKGETEKYIKTARPRPETRTGMITDKGHEFFQTGALSRRDLRGNRGDVL